MSGDKVAAFLVVLTFLWTPARGDVSCLFMESCVLPCSFESGPEIVIHWMREPEAVHAYYHNADQLAHQDPRFRGRTSLFKNQISRGNASLQLTTVDLRDRGKYKCYTSTIKGNKEQYVNLKVEAPVHKVNIEQGDNSITCSSEGIHPEPELTWSTRPPSNLTIVNKNVHQTEQVYNISSSLVLPDNSEGLEYICDVSAQGSSWRATVRQHAPINSLGTETTIPCSASNAPPTSLVWRFNHSQIILNRTRANVHYTVSETWRQKVKEVSESGSLTLKDLSSRQEGTYTCELTNDNETYVINTDLTVGQHLHQVNPSVIAGIVVGVIVVIVGATALGLWYRRVNSKKKRPVPTTGKEMEKRGGTGKQSPEMEESTDEKLLNGREADVEQNES